MLNTYCLRQAAETQKSIKSLPKGHTVLAFLASWRENFEEPRVQNVLAPDNMPAKAVTIEKCLGRFILSDRLQGGVLV